MLAPSREQNNENATGGKQSIEVCATGGDAYSAGPPDAPPSATPPPNAVALYNDLQRLKLTVNTIAPIHGRGAVPLAELKKTTGVN
jgi:hypothetical protein